MSSTSTIRRENLRPELAKRKQSPPSLASSTGRLKKITQATPYELIEMERAGVPGVTVKALARDLNLPMGRFVQIIGAPKATVARKFAARKNLTGSSAYSALGTIRLVGIVESILAESTHPDAKKVNAAKWLGEWIETIQPALGGKKPADIMDTPTGMVMVGRVLGAISSGAYL